MALIDIRAKRDRRNDPSYKPVYSPPVIGKSRFNAPTGISQTLAMDNTAPRTRVRSAKL